MSEETKSTVLITNDDGIETHFFKVLVDALSTRFNVYVAAPKSEQSWISRSISRRRDVSVERFSGFDCKGAWVIDGTPTDCTNIALGHLLPEKPDVVVSGINLGFNYTLPMIMGSGTVAGALEGAFWGIPAVAFSKAIPMTLFEEVRENKGKFKTPDAIASLEATANMTIGLTERLVGRKVSDVVVHNYNFPEVVTDETEIVETKPGLISIGPLFQPESENLYKFKFKAAELSCEDPSSDIETVKGGRISYSTLNYSGLLKNER